MRKSCGLPLRRCRLPKWAEAVSARFARIGKRSKTTLCAKRCERNFPYVEAGPGARGSGRLWSVVEIDPATGHFAANGEPGALRVWAYRERPVYTFAGDVQAGEVNADGLGDFQAEREGFRAFWWRDDFFRE